MYEYIHINISVCVCVFIYIYILTNLLSTSIYGDKENEKKTPEFRDNNISNHLGFGR